MAIDGSIMDIALEAMAKQQLQRLLLVRVHYGELSHVVEDSLQLCFEVLSREAGQEGVVLELVRLPLRFRCGTCDESFEVEAEYIFQNPCPHCGAISGHIMEQGRELFIQSIEAE